MRDKVEQYASEEMRDKKLHAEDAKDGIQGDKIRHTVMKMEEVYQRWGTHGRDRRDGGQRWGRQEASLTTEGVCGTMLVNQQCRQD